MLHPNQLYVNEAWMVFKLNDAPISTESDGDFNLVALMDAASCFMLSTTTLAANSTELSQFEAKRLLKNGQSHKNQLPTKLLIPDTLLGTQLAIEAHRLKIIVQRIAEAELELFIGEARESFKQYLGGGSTQ